MERHETKPSKRLGQNFLIDQRALKAAIDAANLNKEDVVLEVGSGIGTLTQALAEHAGKIIAIEKDFTMIEILKETLADYKNVEVINGDILRYTPDATQYKVVANIPYYLTSAMIRRFLEDKYPPKIMVLMVQKEVAQRMSAKPPNMSLLAAAVQYYAKVDIIRQVSRNCFWPAPSVDSTIIAITPQESRSPEESQRFFRVVKAGFSQPRKQLGNNLSHGLKKDKYTVQKWLAGNGILPTQRAQTLNVAQWIALASSAEAVDE